MLQAPRATHRPGATISAAVAVILLAAPAAANARSAHHHAGRAAAKKAPRAPKVTPNQEGKVAAFPVRYDDENGFSAQIVRILQAHGLEVSTDTRRVDTSEQFRELSTALGFAAYVDGQYDEGPVRSKLTIQVRNGWTGRKVAAVTFRETKLHLRTEVEDKLWTKIGPAIAHACTDASKPRKRDRDPMMIEAGTPLADR
jgi:hypothetical protein